MSQKALRDEIVRGLAARFHGLDLAGAATTKIATELSRRHGRAIPAEEVEAAAERFGVRLRTACAAMRLVPEG